MSANYNFFVNKINAIAGGTVKATLDASVYTLASLELSGSPTTITQAMVDSAASCQIWSSVNSLKFMYDGGDPSTVNGVVLAAGAVYTVQGNDNVKRLKLTRNTATDAVIFIILERME